MTRFALFCIGAGLLGLASQSAWGQSCSACMGEEQTVRFHLRGVANMAGSATIQIKYGETEFTATMTGGSVVADPNNPGKYKVAYFECAQWDQEITVEPKLDQPVLIKYIYETNNTSSGYTEFTNVGTYNPITYYTKPSLPCLKLYFDQNDGNWQSEDALAGGIATFSSFEEVRMKGVVATDDSDIGSGSISAGGGDPEAFAAQLMDAPDVGDVMGDCPGQDNSTQMMSSAARSASVQTTLSTETAFSTKTGRTTKIRHDGRASIGFKPRPIRLDALLVNKASTNAASKAPHASPSPLFSFLTEIKDGKPDQQTQKLQIRGLQPRLQYLGIKETGSNETSPQSGAGHQKAGKTSSTSVTMSSATAAALAVLSSPNGYSIANQIGRLRWEMSLGSQGRMHKLGQLIYQADAWDSTAYSPERLTLSSGGDTSFVLRDTNGVLRQISVGGSFVDITTTANGFQVAVYPMAQVGSSNAQTGFFNVSGSPTLAWTAQNTGSGQIRFTKSQGGITTEVHDAQWQGTVGSSGTMTISRFNGKWTEVRDYSLAANGTQRIETVSLFKQGVLQHKSREVHQQFNNWGDPGDVFEALVQRVEDPDGKALTTTYSFWDSTNLPANQLYEVSYPDGYVERIPSRLSGTNFWPVTSQGQELQRIEPFRDSLPDSSGARSITNIYTQTPTNFVEETMTMVAGGVVGYRKSIYELDIDQNGTSYWVKNSFDVAANNNGPYAYSQEVRDPATLRLLTTLDRGGRTTSFYNLSGFWNPTSETFDYNPFAGSVPAMERRVVHGSEFNWDGVPGKTVVDVTIEDQYGHAVAEESYVSDGSTAIGAAGLISRKTHTYTDGRLTATHESGRLTYQASYNSDDLLQWEEDASGHHTDYVYDEMRRVHQRIIRGRGGDADQACTYEYDVLGNKVSEVTVAGGLTNQAQWIYNLAGELTAVIGTDGLTNSVSSSYGSGYKVVTETYPNQATKITSYYKDRSPRSVTGTAVEDEYYYPYTVVYPASSLAEAVGTYRDSALTQTKQIRIVNWLGDEILSQTPQFNNSGNPRNRYTEYDADIYGQSRQRVADIIETGRPTQIFDYDELGRLYAQGLDFNGDWLVSAASSEPLMLYYRLFNWNTNGTPNVWEDVSSTFRYATNNSTVATLVQRTRVTVPNGLTGNLVGKTVLEKPGGAQVVTTVSLDSTTGNITTSVVDEELGQTRTRLERDGLVRSETQSGIANPRTYNYTALGEVQVVNDPVSGSITNSYDAATRRLVSVTDSLNRSTTYDYYPIGSGSPGRIRGVQDAAGNWTYFDYTPAGQMFRQWGVNTYPVQQGYDEAGRMTNLMTFRTTSNTVNWATSTWPSPSGGDVTRWIYDPWTGLLQSKVYADNKGVSYSYDSGLFLNVKTNGRGQTISYRLDTVGQLTNVVYSDGTMPVTMEYDRAGRLQKVTDASGTRTISWTDRDQMEDEVYTNGLLAGLTVDRGYDAQFRLSTLGLSLNGVPTLRNRMVYDSISRLDYINDETPDGATVLHQFDYSYKAGLPFVESVAFLRGTTAVMTNTYSRDNLGRLSGAGTVLAGGSVINGINYQFDTLDRRYEAALADGTKWNYGYNNRSEVTSGKRQLASGAYAGGEQFEYAFDDIGNRTQSKFGGDAVGTSLRLVNYSANALNQYSSREVPGSMWIAGEADTNLTLQGIAEHQPFKVQRQEGNRFFGEATADNSTNAVFARITVAGKANSVLNDVETGHRFVPKTPETFLYDDDGNLVQDGRWIYAWDAENRLKSVTSRSDIPDAAKRKVEFVYDYAGRRVQKIALTWNGTGFAAFNTNKFVYNAWNLMAILDPQSSILESFAWGTDLSGTLQGAGGVGGLLSMKITDTNTIAFYYGFDGNGNVKVVVNSLNSNVTAQYEYGPFGEVVRETGLLAESNPFRFSTKVQDSETGLLYYGYRHYSASTGRWLSRDPLEERGGGLYSFVANSPIDNRDPFGLYQEGGHYYTTYIAGVIAGNSDPSLLAFYSQLPDEITSFTAYDTLLSSGPKALGNALTGGFLAPYFDDVQRYIHSLAGGKAQLRRDCLRKLLSDPTLQPWERGILIHPFADSYAHSYNDKNGNAVLYKAPFGHGKDGSNPDYVHLRKDLYGMYLTDLVKTLSGGQISAQQKAKIQAVISQINGFPEDQKPQDEINSFLKIAVEQFGYSQTGYAPENYEAISSKKFLNGPGKGLGYKIPTEKEMKALIEKIKKACCPAH